MDAQFDSWLPRPSLPPGGNSSYVLVAVSDDSDLALLLASCGIDAGGDLDGDGDTDLSDLAILLSNYGA